MEEHRVVVHGDFFGKRQQRWSISIKGSAGRGDRKELP